MTDALGMRVKVRAATPVASVVPFAGIDPDQLTA